MIEIFKERLKKDKAEKLEKLIQAHERRECMDIMWKYSNEHSKACFEYQKYIIDPKKYVYEQLNKYQGDKGIGLNE